MCLYFYNYIFININDLRDWVVHIYSSLILPKYLSSLFLLVGLGLDGEVSGWAAEGTVALLEQLQLVVVCVEHLRKDNKRINNKKELQNVKEYASDQSRILVVADLSEMNRREMKNRKAFKIWTAVPGEEKYKIGAVGQILETIRFILFRDGSFTRGQSNIRRFIYERSVDNIRDWSLAYSFICEDRKIIDLFDVWDVVGAEVEDLEVDQPREEIILQLDQTILSQSSN